MEGESSKDLTKEAATSKRNYSRLDFTPEQEEQLINYVKLNPAMFNPKDINYKNRGSFFDRFGATINKSGISYSVSLNFRLLNTFRSSGSECIKKWTHIRDAYNRSKGKKLGTGSSAAQKNLRNEAMAFLDEVVTVNKKLVNSNFIQNSYFSNHFVLMFFDSFQNDHKYTI